MEEGSGCESRRGSSVPRTLTPGTCAPRLFSRATDSCIEWLACHEPVTRHSRCRRSPSSP
eukprot:1594639-Pleurochrysis_carterae.AAC.1